jgi:hypothetical protein
MKEQCKWIDTVSLASRREHVMSHLVDVVTDAVVGVE